MSALRLLTFALAERQQWRCIWCEFRMAWDHHQADNLLFLEAPYGRRRKITPVTMRRASEAILVSFEHFLPRSEGGEDHPHNAFAACRWCNNFRRCDDALEFKARIVAMLAAEGHPRQVFRASGAWPKFSHGRPRSVSRQGAAA